MNASAAPLGKGLSEFQLVHGQEGMRVIPTPLPAPHIQAPYVSESPLFMECKYVKTIKIPDINANDSMYSLIIGEVIHIHARKDVVVNKHHVGDDGRGGERLGIDLQKIKPVARLGYGQEYTVVTNEV